MNDITLKDAKFEVEIELQNHDGSDEIFMEKIKVFQCDSESSGSDSYRIKPIIWKEGRKMSHKIPRGRKLTFQEDDFFKNKGKIFMLVNTSSTIMKLWSIFVFRWWIFKVY